MEVKQWKPWHRMERSTSRSGRFTPGDRVPGAFWLGLTDCAEAVTKKSPVLAGIDLSRPASSQSLYFLFDKRGLYIRLPGSNHKMNTHRKSREARGLGAGSLHVARHTIGRT